MTYSYASGDLLEQRNTYFYSAYQGPGLIDAWRRQRHEVETDLAIGAGAAHGSEEPLPIGPTDWLLQSMYRTLSTQGGLSEQTQLERLVQRFEVSKRLHGEYDATWRPVDPADYRSSERYVRFAEILQLAYGFSGRITYLNTLLKVVDTLTAMRATLTVHQRARLRDVVGQERRYIDALHAAVEAKKHAP
ncbi:MAG: hypothetical protein C5B46_03010 [Proteobacteria bacterium]|nr:MAG: hypothetical protein C5B46_03010 [Pseudomonadota bacterium]